MYPIGKVLVLAIICASVDIVSYVGYEYYVGLPFFACSVAYSGLTLLAFKKQVINDARTHIWTIFASGLCDFAAEALLCWSLKYTSASSVSLFLNL